MASKKSIAVLGEGAWGTAIASLLAYNGYRVNLWCHDLEVKKTIEQKRSNDHYLPGFVLHKNIFPSTELNEVLSGSIWVFEAIPVQYLRSVAQQCAPFISQEQRWVILSKGIEQETLLLPSQLLDDVFPVSVHKAAVVGPSFARDLMHQEITAVNVAAYDASIGTELQLLLANAYFRPYFTHDVLGVQICAAVKNALGLLLGIADGAGCSDNTRAFLVTKALQEMQQVCLAMGGKRETVYGLSGVGDLLLSVLGSQSRNVEVGRKLGQQQKLETILQETGYIPEGINTVQSLYALLQKYSLNLPICRGIHAIIFEHKSINDFLAELMTNPLQNECDE